MTKIARNHQLDGLRGYAALAVAVFHTILSVDATLVPRILYGDVTKFQDAYSWFAKVILKIFSGETAVFIFFVLSGAVLSKSLLSSQQTVSVQAICFAIKRFFRIYPTLLLNLILMTLCLVGLGRSVGAQDFLINATLYAFPINGATWTLNVEMVAIPFILVAYWGFKVGREWGLIAIAIAIEIALRLPPLQSFAVTFRDNWSLFVLGMLIPTRLGSWTAGIMPTVAPAIFLLVATIFKGAIQPIAIALFVNALYYDRAGRVGKFLEAPISQLFGRISFSFYLYHPLVISSLAGLPSIWPTSSSHPIEVGLLASIPVVLATAALADLSTRYIELPGIALGRVISNQIVAATNPRSSLSAPAQSPGGLDS